MGVFSIGLVSGVRAMTMACLEKIPSDEERVTGSLKPWSWRRRCQREAGIKGWEGRRLWSVNLHQPSARPKMRSTKRTGSGTLEQQEQGAGSGQVQDMVQGLAQIPGGMEDVGGQDEVEVLGTEALSRGGLFDVQELIADEGKRGELFLGLGEEQGRDIGKDIFGLIGREAGEDEGSSATGTGADLEDAEGSVARQAREGFEDGFLQERVGRHGRQESRDRGCRRL